MSPKPWDVTDDELAQGAVPVVADAQDETVDVDDDYELVDSADEWDDPWASDPAPTGPTVPPARRIGESPAKSGATAPAAKATPAAEAGAGTTVASAEQPQRELSDPSGERARETSIEDGRDETGPEPLPSTAPDAAPAPESDTQAGPESDPAAELGIESGEEPVREPAAPADEPGSPVADDFDDFDDFWDEPVSPETDTGTTGYDLRPSPAMAADLAETPTPVPGGVGSPAEGAADEAVDEDDPDDSITVTLRRNREPQRAATQSREYRTSSESRRPVRPSERRHKMDAAPVKQGPVAKLKKMLTGDADLARAHETSAKRDTIRPLNVVVMGKKGGVGKTVVTALLGHTFASVRNDRVLAVDASPTGGNLSARCPKEGKGTVVSLLDQLEYVSSYANVREHTAKGDTGLEVLGADVTRPQRPITGDDYRQLLDELRRHYQLILSDTPGDITTASAAGESIVPALLDEADLLVVVAEGVDGANAATWLVNWLKSRLRETDDRHLEALLDDLIVVVTSRSPRTNAKPDRMAKYFSEQIARRVVQVPFDPVVEGGLEIDYSLISTKTRKAMLELADAITGSDAFTGR